MPLVRSDDQGDQAGFVHSHRFPRANTAVPFANHDETQLQATSDFLRAGILTLDIFAASEAMPEAPSRRSGAPAGAPLGDAAEPQAASFFPDLPEVGPGGPPTPGAARRARRSALIAPLDRADPFLLPGKTYRIDVVARPRRSCPSRVRETARRPRGPSRPISTTGSSGSPATRRTSPGRSRRSPTCRSWRWPRTA